MDRLNGTCLSVLNKTETVRFLFNQKSSAHKNKSKILISHDNHLPVTYLAHSKRKIHLSRVCTRLYIGIYMYVCITGSVHSRMTFEVEFSGSKEVKCQFF